MKIRPPRVLGCFLAGLLARAFALEGEPPAAPPVPDLSPAVFAAPAPAALPPAVLPAPALLSASYPAVSPSAVFPGGRPLRAVRREDGTPLPESGVRAGGGAALSLIAECGGSLTEEYIARYSAPSGIKWLNGVMADAAPWLPFIREEIARRNLPAELLYLPVIESAYKTAARSRSGAAGLWQFMENSVAPFGIRIAPWLDERLDFWKSTEGALRKLEDNYRELGDWSLALAAYNMGLGGIRRIMKQSGAETYADLTARGLVSRENEHYVPRFLAAAHVLSNSRRFGVEPVWGEDPRWVRVRAAHSVDLEQLALLAGLDVPLFRAANAEYLSGVAPQGHYLKIPAAARAAVESLIAAGSARAAPFPHAHRVEKGETLWGIARRYGTTPEAIAEANGLAPDGVLHAGRTINIPIME
ncbi:MAG: transglycosylase SLT domain-containing protein [Spirochaetaceae bacterium]|nr:transglycosylase SLT domain-containing protein [Spirochaetaceae bacterium]